MAKNTSKASKGGNTVAEIKAEAAKLSSKPEAKPTQKNGGKGPKNAKNGKPARKVGEKHNPKAGSTEERRTKKIQKVKGIECTTRVNTATDGRAAGHFASVTIFGFPLSQVLRTAGKNGLSSGEMRAVCDALGLTEVRTNTIRDKVGEGRNGEEVKYAPLDRKQLARLKELAAE